MRDRRNQPPSIHVEPDVHKALVSYCTQGDEQKVIRHVTSAAIREYLAKQGFEVDLTPVTS